MGRSIIFEDAIDVRDKKRRLAETIVKPWNYIYTDPNAPAPEPEPEIMQAISAETEPESVVAQDVVPDAGDYNATTGSYSGSYGKGPIDESTKAMAADILAARNNEMDEIMKLMEAAKNGDI